jgi:hypothetical protein
MHHINRVWEYILDGASGSAFFYGWIAGHDLLMILGGLASLAAIINHTEQFLNRRRKRK